MQDQKYGFGTYWYPDGTVYKGFWHDGLKNQSGELYLNNGQVFRTEYNKNTLLSKDDITNQMPRDSLRNLHAQRHALQNGGQVFDSFLEDDKVLRSEQLFLPQQEGSNFQNPNSQALSQISAPQNVQTSYYEAMIQRQHQSMANSSPVMDDGMGMGRRNPSGFQNTSQIPQQNGDYFYSEMLRRSSQSPQHQSYAPNYY